MGGCGATSGAINHFLRARASARIVSATARRGAKVAETSRRLNAERVKKQCSSLLCRRGSSFGRGDGAG